MLDACAESLCSQYIQLLKREPGFLKLLPLLRLALFRPGLPRIGNVPSADEITDRQGPPTSICLRTEQVKGRGGVARGPELQRSEYLDTWYRPNRSSARPPPLCRKSREPSKALLQCQLFEVGYSPTSPCLCRVSVVPCAILSKENFCLSATSAHLFDLRNLCVADGIFRSPPATAMLGQWLHVGLKEGLQVHISSRLPSASLATGAHPAPEKFGRPSIHHHFSYRF